MTAPWLRLRLKIQFEDLDELYVKLLTEGKRNGGGGGLSAKSVRNVHATLQSALSYAARKGTVVRNVADTADPPSISRSGRSICVWTGYQLRCFLDAMAGHELYALYLLAASHRDAPGRDRRPAVAQR